MRSIVILAAGALTALLCCSQAGEDDEGDVTDDGAGGGFGGGFLAGGSSAGGGDTGCSDAAKLIYVLTDTNELLSFKPDEQLFASVGTISCSGSLQPNSMAIDRDAVAWVNFVGSDGVFDNQGVIYKVSTADASCDPVPTVTLPAGWYRIGMGFSTDGANTESETLFVTSIGLTGSLGRIEMSDFSLVELGQFTGQFANQSAELTGTGDGRLYGFFTSTPVEVAQLDKATGNVLSSVPLPTVEVPSAWAFSFWGGDFYLYTAQLASLSRVNHYDPDSGAVDPSFIPSVGARIVGAGVSTCAPLEPPK